MGGVAGRGVPARVPPWAVAAALGLAWLALAPRTPDLAAQAYRAELFDRAGLAIWNGAWFGGHHLPGYSLLFPPLGGLLGPRVVGVLCAVASTLLFARLARTAWGPAAWPGILWLAAASVADLAIGRITYALGVALGLAALAALQARRPLLATVLAVACSAGSPVAGAFLALAGVSVAAGRSLDLRRRRLRLPPDGLDRAALAMAAAALATVAALAVAFPEGGTLTLPVGPTLTVLGSCLALVVLLPPGERVLRTGAVLYALTALALFAVPTPMGSNVVRLGATFAGPVLVAAAGASGLAGRRRAVLAAVAAGLLLWQWQGPVREMGKGAGDPSTQAAYYEGVLGFLAAQAGPGGPDFRVEVPFTQSHWESVHLGGRVPLARGWATQLDRRYNGLFFSGDLDPEAYRAWLARNAVRWVAVPDVPLDPAGRQEAALIAGGLPYLREVWSDEHWRVYRVADPAELVEGPGELTSFGLDAFTLRADRPGSFLIRARHTPYWRPRGADACVSRAPGGWTRVSAREAGTLTVEARFSLGRIAATGPACTRGQAPGGGSK